MTETAMKLPTEMTPAEIDTELATLWYERQKYEAWAANARKYLKDYERRGDKACAERMWVEVDRYQAEVVRLKAAAVPFEDEFAARGGWLRYFLVTNANGHVHRGMDCTTCYARTTYAWLPELSDCVEGDMVEEFGEKACTICFPNAPAYKAFQGPGRRDAAAKAERDAEKAAREAKIAEKAITAPDGSPLRVPSYVSTNWKTGEKMQNYETYRTKVSARNALSGAVQSYGHYGSRDGAGEYLVQARILIEALEAAGIETTPVIERAAKKAIKEGGQYDIRKVMA